MPKCLGKVMKNPEEAVAYHVFEECLPEYVKMVEKWMLESEDYLRRDFKLLDVSAALPINRSYISRIFNEGMGSSFSQVVKKYRIEKAKKMIETHPNLSVQEVARRCGFVYIKFVPCFKKHVGVYPRKYREIFWD